LTGVRAAFSDSIAVRLDPPVIDSTGANIQAVPENNT
jgi:hypothetical protein